MRHPFVAAIVCASAAFAATESAPGAQATATLIQQARVVGQVPAFENEYVRVTYELLEYAASRDGRDAPRPPVLYLSLFPRPGLLNARVLEPPAGARPQRREGVVPRAVRIESLAPPPPPPRLGTPGTDPPRGAAVQNAWEGGRLITSAFRPFDYGIGAGPYPSVTVFLSDGVLDVSTAGVRRRMAVQAGDAFWLDAATRITVIDDYPVGAAIIQLIAPR